MATPERVQSKNSLARSGACVESAVPVKGIVYFWACNTACVTTATPALALSCTKPQDFLATKGLTIQDVSGATLAAPSALPPFNGVAYVLISHGENFAGAYNSQGILIAGTGMVGTNETTNSNNQPFKTTYIDAQYDSSQSTAHFDDLIFRPTIAQIIDHAKLSARAR